MERVVGGNNVVVVKAVEVGKVDVVPTVEAENIKQ